MRISRYDINKIYHWHLAFKIQLSSLLSLLTLFLSCLSIPSSRFLPTSLLSSYFSSFLLTFYHKSRAILNSSPYLFTLLTFSFFVSFLTSSYFLCLSSLSPLVTFFSFSPILTFFSIYLAPFLPITYYLRYFLLIFSSNSSLYSTSLQTNSNYRRWRQSATGNRFD